MNLTNQDWAMIEDALRQAIHSGTDYRMAMNYKSVLTKLQSIHPDEMGAIRNGAAYLQSAPFEDGIRYDYDDSSDLR